MIWSVSTSSRMSVDTGPLTVVKASMVLLAPVADVDEPALDGGRSGHLGRDEVRAAATALAPLEVAVRGRGAALAGAQRVGVHPQAHAAARAAPVEAGGAEHLVEALRLGLLLDLHRTRDHHRVDRRSDLAALDDLGGGAQVADARVRARADEDAVQADVLHGGAGPQVHVLQGALLAVAARLGD